MRSVVQCPSTQCDAIGADTASCALVVSCARSRLFGNFACGTSRKIGTVTFSRPVFERYTIA